MEEVVNILTNNSASKEKIYQSLFTQINSNVILISHLIHIVASKTINDSARKAASEILEFLCGYFYIKNIASKEGPIWKLLERCDNSDGPLISALKYLTRTFTIEDIYEIFKEIEVTVADDDQRKKFQAYFGLHRFTDPFFDLTEYIYYLFGDVMAKEMKTLFNDRTETSLQIQICIIKIHNNLIIYSDTFAMSHERFLFWIDVICNIIEREEKDQKIGQVDDNDHSGNSQGLTCKFHSLELLQYFIKGVVKIQDVHDDYNVWSGQLIDEKVFLVLIRVFDRYFGGEKISDKVLSRTLAALCNMFCFPSTRNLKQFYIHLLMKDYLFHPCLIDRLDGADWIDVETLLEPNYKEALNIIINTLQSCDSKDTEKAAAIRIAGFVFESLLNLNQHYFNTDQFICKYIIPFSKYSGMVSCQKELLNFISKLSWIRYNNKTVLISLFNEVINAIIQESDSSNKSRLYETLNNFISIHKNMMDKILLKKLESILPQIFADMECKDYFYWLTSIIVYICTHCDEETATTVVTRLKKFYSSVLPTKNGSMNEKISDRLEWCLMEISFARQKLSNITVNDDVD